MKTPLPIMPATTPLATYAYSYPHKSSYGPLTPPVSIADAWSDENVDRLSLYLHVPFCEMRCGFCNLFTQSQPAVAFVEEYVATTLRQMRVISECVPHARFEQFAIGGGTPTFLSAVHLERLLAGLETQFRLRLRSLPTSVESSPATATRDRLEVLAAFGVDRISLGVQTFDSHDAQLIGRPQNRAATNAAIETIRDLGFPILNLDLIYGDPRQTRETWLQSLDEALRFEPEELYLYPLYVRPETGLARVGHRMGAIRGDLYQAARERLLTLGYRQLSLRCFQKPHIASMSTYACQRDGMIGLGCGARSYTRRLHYATRFAVTQSEIRKILAEWISLSDEDLAFATHGIRLGEDEQRRRYLIMSLLQTEGMATDDYRSLFSSSPWTDVPELERLSNRGWLENSTDRLVLTADGVEHSDEIGPMLYSSSVRSRLEEFVRL